MNQTDMPQCPSCKYTPLDDVDNEGLYPRTDPPATHEEALDFFEAAGADEGCVFCPRCMCEFKVETGEARKWTEDDYDGSLIR